MFIGNQNMNNSGRFINMIITLQNIEQQHLPVKKEIDAVKHSCQF